MVSRSNKNLEKKRNCKSLKDKSLKLKNNKKMNGGANKTRKTNQPQEVIVHNKTSFLGNLTQGFGLGVGISIGQNMFEGVINSVFGE